MRAATLTPADHSGAATEMVDVIVGYLITHQDGYEARLGPDRTRANLYAERSRATLEPMFVRRQAPSRAPRR